MRKLISIWGIVLVVGLAYPGQAVIGQGSVQSLRGGVDMAETTPAPTVRKQNTNAGRFSRAYRQQPPLIPHNIEKYQVNLKVNQCMRCHDWPFNVDEGAPKISETHYLDRDGVALDRVAPRRWFCTQCHVPQVNARPLVNNDFEPVFKVR